MIGLILQINILHSLKNFISCLEIVILAIYYDIPG